MKITVKGIGAPALTKLILGIIVIASIFYLLMSGYQTYSYKITLGWKQMSLRSYEKEGITNLENKRTTFEEQLNEISTYYKEIIETLSSKPKSRMPKEGDPLRFKEELYKIQTKLKQDGSPIGFEFPAGLGFAKYEKEIPSASELPIRVKQLEIIQEIGDLMLKAKVPKITDVEFKDIKDITLEKSKDILYKEFPLEVSFKCKNENLINFLHGLTISDIPFMIDSINLKTSDDRVETKDELEVQLVILAAIFP
ncbi:MAG: hypothetical protein AMJ78_06985 [Omnitrophica WOR_2 bacterium SM23_29]|nr:MAG: hypothetical protein AMJ78_06985 [Omnitrophica WOR_2 bacterium SM23_29]